MYTCMVGGCALMYIIRNSIIKLLKTTGQRQSTQPPTNMFRGSSGE